MDNIDINILRCLIKDARMNASQISNTVNLSVSAVIERMKKLENSGLIRGYTALIDERMAGYDVQAMISVRLEHPKFYESFVSEINARHCIAECYHIAGDFDFITKVLAENGQNLEEILADIKSINGVSLTRTTVVLSTNKHEVCLLPDKQKFM